MKEKTHRIDVGVIVGRFHCHELHEAHRDLIQSVINRHDRVILFLGLSVLKNTLENPLDFKHRKKMIEEEFKDAVEVHYIDNNRSDEVWSKNLDRQIQKWLNPHQSVCLYGSRDSFLSRYHGAYNTCELESTTFISGTEVRKRIINKYPTSKDFRAGMIAATGTRFPTAYQTVDIAVVNEDTQEVLLVKKPGEEKWRFIGGFSDPKSNSLESDAKREVAEETGVEIGDPIYIGSCKIQDWRYRGEQDTIKTAVFYAKYVYGSPKGADDVEFARWFQIHELTPENIMEEHHQLIVMFNKYMANN